MIRILPGVLIILVLAVQTSAMAQTPQRIAPAGYADPVSATDRYAPPARPAGHGGTDGDLFAALQAEVLADRVDAMPDAEYYWWRYHVRLANLQREAGVQTWIQRNPASGAPAPVTPRPAAPAPVRPAHCSADGTCAYAVVAHAGDARDAYERSYDGTRLSWGIRVTDRAVGPYTQRFAACGVTFYARDVDAANIRGRLSPTSEAYIRRYSLYPFESGPVICSWTPPRYTGPNR